MLSLVLGNSFNFHMIFVYIHCSFILNQAAVAVAVQYLYFNFHNKNVKYRLKYCDKYVKECMETIYWKKTFAYLSTLFYLTIIPSVKYIAWI